MYQKYPDNLPNLRNHLDLYDPSPFTEKRLNRQSRIETVVADAVARHKDGPLLFVGHGASLTAAIQWMTGKS